MKVIQKGKAHSKIQLSPEESEHIYFALMSKVANTLAAKQRTSVDVTIDQLNKQLTIELDLLEEFDKLRD